MLLNFNKVTISALLAHAGVVSARTAASKPDAPIKRAEGDVFTFTGLGGDMYWALIQSQSNSDEPRYSPDEGLTAWDNGLNSLVQDIRSTTMSSSTDLADGTTISVRGSMVGGEEWVAIGDSAEWNSIFQEFQVENQVQLDPQYLYFTLGKEENTVNFNASFTLQWIDTS